MSVTMNHKPMTLEEIWAIAKTAHEEIQSIDFENHKYAEDAKYKDYDAKIEVDVADMKLMLMLLDHYKQYLEGQLNSPFPN